MAILKNPITLPASKMLAAMTTLIGEIRYSDTLMATDVVDGLVDSCRIGNVDAGKGIVYNFKVDVQPVKDLSETSSVTTITKPNLAQETIVIDNYKFVPLSISDILAKDALVPGYSIDSFHEFVLSLLEDTAKFYLFDICNNLYQDWTPGKTSQSIEVPQVDVSALTGADLVAANQLNGAAVAKAIRKTLNNMKIKNTLFTDVTKYTAQDGSQKDVVSAIAGRDLKLVFNDKYYTDFLADTMASLFHAATVGEMIDAGQLLILPENAMATKNATTIAWLSDKMKFAMADFYKITRSFNDASTLYENYFYHFAFGAGVFQTAPGVRFVAKVQAAQNVAAYSASK